VVLGLFLDAMEEGEKREFGSTLVGVHIVVGVCRGVDIEAIGHVVGGVEMESVVVDEDETEDNWLRVPEGVQLVRVEDLLVWVVLFHLHHLVVDHQVEDQVGVLVGLMEVVMLVVLEMVL
jgi:hypothetical protein